MAFYRAFIPLRHHRLMDGNSPQTVIVGSRAWSGFGFALCAALGSVVLGAALYGWAHGQGGRAFFMAAAALCLLVYAVDNFVRTIRPNRFLLDDQGLELQTWRVTRRWPWNAYRGLRGVGGQALRVDDGKGKARVVGIGNWPRDLEHRLYVHASARGSSVEEPPPRRPSAALELLLGGALVLFAVAVGLSAA